MNIETEFSLNQEVWQIGRSHDEPVELPCRFCRGARSLRVTAPNGVDYEYVQCPRCRGAGQATIAGIPTYTVVRSARIGKIEATRTDHSVPGYNGGLNDDRANSDRYMIGETGFPSGTVYTNTSLYASLADAEEMVEEKNAALRRGAYNEFKPNQRHVEMARSFLEHRDAYEHTPEHVAAAELLIAAYEYDPEEERDDE